MPAGKRKGEKMRKMWALFVVILLVVVTFTEIVYAEVDGFVFIDKIQTTIRAESWENQITKDTVYRWYGKVNISRKDNANFFGEGQINYLPIKIGSVKIGAEANVQVAHPSNTEVLGRGYLAAKVGPFLLRYSLIQTDGNHKLSVCWFQKWDKFSAFGYYDRNLNRGQKPLNIAEGYIGYDVAKDVMVTTGIKPVWTDSQTPNVNPGIGIRIKF
jgi:hypothetical protein